MKRQGRTKELTYEEIANREFKNAVPQNDKYKEYKMDLLVFDYVLKGFIKGNQGTEYFRQKCKDCLEFINVMKDYKKYPIGGLMCDSQFIDYISTGFINHDDIKKYIKGLNLTEYDKVFYQTNNNETPILYAVKQKEGDNKINPDIKRIISELLE